MPKEIGGGGTVVYLLLTIVMLSCTVHVGEKKRLSDELGSDYYEYTRGKKIPPEGIPGFDFSDPESIVEFTK